MGFSDFREKRGIREFESGLNPDRTYYEDLIKIPGFGRKPERCQNYMPVGFCEHGHVALAQSSCGIKECPDHYEDYIKKSTRSEVERLAKYREAQSEGFDRRLCHIVISPPQDRYWQADSVFEKRSEAYDVLKKAGVRGGSVHVHPYRTSEHADFLYNTAKEKGELERAGKWRFLRSLAISWDDMQEFIEPAPHYHVLGAVRDLDTSKIPEGWVVKNIRSFNKFHREDKESYLDMVRVGWYLRTHSAEFAGRQSVTYFGELAPSVFSPGEELDGKVSMEIEGLLNSIFDENPHEDNECGRDGCHAEVLDLLYLDDYLSNQEWLGSVEPKDRAVLRGLRLWWVLEADRPPPGRRGDREKLLRWLERAGARSVATASSRVPDQQVRFNV